MATERNIAVIGTGYWGKNLVRNYDGLGALRLLCDTNETTLESFREMYPDVRTCQSFSDVLTDDGVRGVVLATPAETHYTLAREALLAGKDVYVEKPLALNEEEGEKIIALARELGRTLMVGHLLQYHPVFTHLKKMVADGELGRINYIYSHRLNLGKIRREENILWSFAPHDISMILALAGEEPSKIMATGGNYLHQQIADVTTTHLEFPSGLKAHIFVSWLHPFKEQKLVVVGDRKMAVFDDTQPWEDKLLLYPHTIEWEGGVPVPNKAESERVDIAQDEPLRLECEEFLRAMKSGKAPITDGEEGLRVQRVLNGAQRALDAGSGVTSAPAEGVSADATVHESAYVDEGVQLGKGTSVWHFSHILPGSRLGANCKVGQNVVIGPDAVIGNGCKIQNNVSVYKGVTLEDDVFCGPSMVFTNVYNPRCHIPRMGELRPTLVKKGATLGANSTVVCGTTLGQYCFVGAGAVVTHNVGDHALVAGNPARRIGWACTCGERLDDDLACPACGEHFRESGDGLAPAK